MRPIDADELLKLIPHEEVCSRFVVANAPTIEPKRKTGKWIDEGFYADGHGAHAFRCSECGGHIIEYDADPFCKWCGADMRGEEDNIPMEYFESGGR